MNYGSCFPWRQPLLHEEQLVMNRKIPKTDWIFIAVIGLLLQSIWLVLVEQPTYMDAYYYATNGERLADGHGFSEMIIWQYLDDPAGLPAPSHTYWMPLPSLIAAVGHTIRGDFLGEQLLFWLLGGLLPLLAFAISLQLSGERWQAWAAALFAATGSFYGAFFSQPSTFAPFAWSGALCLLMLGLAGAAQAERPGEPRLQSSILRRPRVYWLLAGVFAGFAHLTRADGALLLLIGIAIWLLVVWKWRRSSRAAADESQEVEVRSYRPWLDIILLVGGYLLIMGGWLLRNWMVIGRPLSVVGFQSMFLRTYDDLFAYGRTLDLGSYLEWGWDNILLSKLESLWVAIQTLVVVPGVVFLFPFIIIAIVQLYRLPKKRALLRPVVWYTIALLLSMSLVFTFPGMRGAMFHSSSAIWPWSAALAAAGIGYTVDWTAARLPHWHPEKAKKRFSILFIILALVVGLYVSLSRATANDDAEVYSQIAEELPAGSVVMSGNAPAVYYHTKLPSLSIPNEPVDIVVQAADRYGVTHILLDSDAPAPLMELYLGETQDSRLNLIRAFGDINLYQIEGGLE
jgi:hypothetical protein